MDIQYYAHVVIGARVMINNDKGKKCFDNAKNDLEIRETKIEDVCDHHLGHHTASRISA